MEVVVVSSLESIEYRTATVSVRPSRTAVGYTADPIWIDTARRAIASMSVAELLQIFPNVPSCDLVPVDGGWLVPELLATAGVSSSKSEAVRLVKGGGITLNGRRLTDEKERITAAQALEGRIFVIRKGKKENFLIRLITG